MSCWGEKPLTLVKNQNMIRIWGGGVYLPEWMLTMADNMGIMLWHEFRKYMPQILHLLR